MLGARVPGSRRDDLGGGMTALLNAGDIVKGTLRVVRVLGQGSCGAVYEVEGTTTHRHRALKLLPPQFLEPPSARKRFDRDASAAAKQIEDARIARTYGSGVLEDGTPWVLMDLLKGEPLGELLKRRTRWSVADAASLVVELALAMHAAHTAGVVHGDLRPGNVFVVDEGGELKVKVMDFGLAPSFPEKLDSGIAAYSAPEQAADGHFDARADVFALGAVLFELLAGVPPFAGSGAEVLEQKRGSKAAQLGVLRSDCPASLAALAHRALSPTPEGRFATVHEFAEALSHFAPPGHVVAAVPPEPSEVAAHHARRHAALDRQTRWAMLVLCAIASVAAVALMMRADLSARETSHEAATQIDGGSP